MPIEILNPLSLPPEMRDPHLIPPALARASVTERSEQRRRWSTPVNALHALPNFRPPSTPTSLQLARNTLSYDLPPILNPSSVESYVVGDAYPQPAFVVHHLGSIAEEQETRAERTSRHLRETSGSRGRSTSPPRIVAEDQDKYGDVKRSPVMEKIDGPRARPVAVDSRSVAVAGLPATRIGGAGLQPLPSAIPQEPLKRPVALQTGSGVMPTPELRHVSAPLISTDGDTSRPEVATVITSTQPMESAHRDHPPSQASALGQPHRKSVSDLFENQQQRPMLPSISKLAQLGPNGSARGGRGGRVTSLTGLFAGLDVGKEALPVPKARDRPRPVKRMSLPVNVGGA